MLENLPLVETLTATTIAIIVVYLLIKEDIRPLIDRKVQNGSSVKLSKEPEVKEFHKELHEIKEGVAELGRTLEPMYDWMKPDRKGQQQWRMTEADFYKSHMSAILEAEKHNTELLIRILHIIEQTKIKE